MREALRTILINTLAEQEGADETVVLESVVTAISLLLSREELFEDIPHEVHGWENEGNELMPFPFYKKPEDEPGTELSFHPVRGILLHDGLHAAAHGRTKFMYRAKGQRLFLFSDGNLAPVGIYATVDRNGFFLQNTIYEDFAVNVRTHPSPEWLRTPFDFVLGDPNSKETRFIGQDLISLLSNIKKPFKRIFLLENLLIPPDVDIISAFSEEVRETLWDICMSSEFEDTVGRSGQNACMNVLSAASISPAPKQIVAFIRRVSQNNMGTAKLHERLDELEANLGGRIDAIATHLQSRTFWEALFAKLSDTSVMASAINKPTTPADIEAMVLLIVDQFKRLVEDNGLWKELWEESEKPRNESSAQRLFFLMADSYCKARNIDLTPEADLGNGPVDFKMSHGYECKVVVEVKLSTNSKLVHGYEKQLEIYKKADGTDIGVFLVIDVGELGGKLAKVEDLRDQALKANRPASHIRYIDGTRKASASKRV